MNLPIVFQSLERIVGQEGRSKLLHTESKLYAILHQLKQAIAANYSVGDDRMDLHIEITKLRRDEAFRSKAESIHEQEIDLSKPENWGFLGRAFVLWTPTVADYGKTHITIAFFGKHPRPTLADLQKLVQRILV